MVGRGHPWIDSQARENIYEGMPLSPKDDFHLYVNYDYMMRRKNGEKYDASQDVLLQEVKEILEDSVANNAKSLPMINAFMFSIGITKSSGYSSDMSMEEMYGIIGYVLAHEMSHCFDENGSNIDKDGKMNDWWTPEDRITIW